MQDLFFGALLVQRLAQDLGLRRFAAKLAFQFTDATCHLSNDLVTGQVIIL